MSDDVPADTDHSLSKAEVAILESLYGSQHSKWTDLTRELRDASALESLASRKLIRVLPNATVPVLMDVGRTFLGERDVYCITKAGIATYERLRGWDVESQLTSKTPLPSRRHSQDFTSVHWDGRDYVFTRHQQAEVVRLLWQAMENDTPTLKESFLGTEIGSSDALFRLAVLFRDSATKQPHPAWGIMIVAAGKGLFRLAPPGDKKA